MIIKKLIRRYLAALLVFLLAGLILLVMDVVRRRQTVAPSPSGDAAQADSARDVPPAVGQMEAVLFFPAAETSAGSRDILVEETRSVPRSGTVAEQARRVLEELATGSHRGHPAAIPPEARLLQLFLLKDGTAVVNYSQALVDKTPGGIAAELACIYGIVNTLTRNFGEIVSVRILVEGAERETLAGHVDLSGVLKQDLSFIVSYQPASSPVRVEKLPP